MSVALANLLLLLFIRTGRATPTAAEIAEIVRLGWSDAITEAEDARLGWSDSVTEAADARLGWTDAITEAADARLGWTDAITDAGDARLGWTDVITVSLATTASVDIMQPMSTRLHRCALLLQCTDSISHSHPQAYGGPQADRRLTEVADPNGASLLMLPTAIPTANSNPNPYHEFLTMRPQP
tara:strand:+ start:1012 stop:1560 length:549 start_codon:yes stop_codon:yes gene_type:complete